MYTAECFPIYNAVKIAVDNPGHNFLILSDSLSAIMSIRQIKIDTHVSTYVWKTIEQIGKFNHLNKNNSIKFHWFPSHSGIPGNDKAYRLAKYTTEQPYSQEYSVPFTDTREILKKNMYRNTNKYITNLGQAKEKGYFCKYFTIKKHPWYKGQKYSRHLIV